MVESAGTPHFGQRLKRGVPRRSITTQKFQYIGCVYIASDVNSNTYFSSWAAHNDAGRWFDPGDPLLAGSSR